MLRVNNLIGFGAGGSSAAPVAFVADDGDDTATDAQAMNFGANTSTGPTTIVFLTWQDSGGETLSSMTWNGVAGTIIYQDIADATHMAALVGWLNGGAMSGNLIANFTGTVSEAELTKASFSGVQSLTAIDTDTANGADETLSFTTPGASGFVVAAAVADDPGTAGSTSGGTELADLNVGGNFRHIAAYSIGSSTSMSIGGILGGSTRLRIAASLR